MPTDRALAGVTIDWVLRLPEALRPQHLMDQMPRLANQIALAWVMQKQPVTAPIVGVSKLEQLTDAVGAVGVKLTPEDVAALEASYTPRANAGFQ